MFFLGGWVIEEFFICTRVCWEYCVPRGEGDGGSQGEEGKQAACLQGAIQRTFVEWYIWANINKLDLVLHNSLRRHSSKSCKQYPGSFHPGGPD